MKKQFAMILSLILLLSLLPGCSPTGDSAQAAMLADWSCLLEVYEEAYQAALWTYDQTEAFLNANDWDSLLKARAANSASLLALRQMTLPQGTLSEEQCTVLFQEGIEVDVVLMEYEALSANIGNLQQTQTLLTHQLVGNIYLTSGFRTLESWLESSRLCAQLEIRYLWMTTNYLLLQLDAPEQWQRLQERCPVLAAFADPWTEDPDELMLSCDALLDRLSQELIRYSAYVGTAEADLALVAEAAESGNLDAIEAEIHRVSNIPAYIPQPDWLSDVLYLYLITDPQTQEQRLIQACEELSAVPSACYVSCANISQEEVESYAQALVELGFQSSRKWDDGAQTEQILVSRENCQMLIAWTPEETLLYLPHPTACLIPALFFTALS